MQVFGVYPIAATPVPPSFTFNGTPFTYNPANGNLLIEIDKPDGNNAFSAFTDNNNGFSGVSRVWNTNNGPTGNVDLFYGPIVEITFGQAAVPEPGTLCLLGIGILGLVAWGARRTKVA